MSTHALLQSDLHSLPLLARGKVRDNYAVGEDRILMVASDRISAFARYRFAHHHVKSRNAVRGHHQDAVVAHRVVVSHLASGQQGQ